MHSDLQKVLPGPVKLSIISKVEPVNQTREKSFKDVMNQFHHHSDHT